MTINTGTRLSHYSIVSKIGESGMGEVYLAEDTRLDRKVAIKFLFNTRRRSKFRISRGLTRMHADQKKD